MSGRPLHRGCGLKYRNIYIVNAFNWSPSSQRVWIEIRTKSVNVYYNNVALFTEGVDWNTLTQFLFFTIFVALFTEGVDWNKVLLFIQDRYNPSPSSQRVWIEIQKSPPHLIYGDCRPLHRGCGLKSLHYNFYGKNRMSPSSQRVWIEIGQIELLKKSTKSRPLHRGCGLKYGLINFGDLQLGRPLHRGCDWNL